MQRDPDLEEFVHQLLDRAFLHLAKTQMRSGLSRKEARGYIKVRCAAGHLSTTERDTALKNLADWSRWGDRNTAIFMTLLLAGTVFFSYPAIREYGWIGWTARQWGGILAFAIYMVLAGIPHLRRMRGRNARALRAAANTDRVEAPPQ